MRLGPIIKNIAVLPALLVLGAGCGGIAASESISPLMFLLPGLADNRTAPVSKPAAPQPQPVAALAAAN